MREAAGFDRDHTGKRLRQHVGEQSHASVEIQRQRATTIGRDDIEQLADEMAIRLEK